MPYVTLTLTSGLTADKKTELMERASDAVVQSIGAPLAAVRVVLHELAEGAYMNAGNRNETGVLIVVELIEGRTQAQKDALIAMLSRAAADVTGWTEQQHIRVRLIDYPRGNMGMANGLSALTPQ